MRFLLDHNLSPLLAQAIDALCGQQHTVTSLRSHFEVDDLDDEDWLAALGSEGTWVIVSQDVRILRSKKLQRAWLKAGLTTFFLEPGWANLEHWEKAAKLIKWWPKIIQQAGTIAVGTGFRVPVRGARMKIVK